MSGITAKITFPRNTPLESAWKKLRFPGVNKPIERFLLRAGFAIQKNIAEKQFIRGGRQRVKGPRGGSRLISTPAHPSRLTSRTGELRRSYTTDRGLDKSGLPFSVSVGSDLVYASPHEYGENGLPQRRVMLPAIEDESPNFERWLHDEIIKEL